MQNERQHRRAIRRWDCAVKCVHTYNVPRVDPLNAVDGMGLLGHIAIEDLLCSVQLSSFIRRARAAHHRINEVSAGASPALPSLPSTWTSERVSRQRANLTESVGGGEAYNAAVYLSLTG